MLQNEWSKFEVSKRNIAAYTGGQANNSHCLWRNNNNIWSLVCLMIKTEMYGHACCVDNFASSVDWLNNSRLLVYATALLCPVIFNVIRDYERSENGYRYLQPRITR